MRVLILTTFDLDEYVYEAIVAGASGFLVKDVPPDELARGVRTVAAGDALLAPTVVRRLLEEFVRRPPPGGHVPAELQELTEREREVLRFVAYGLSNAEIATDLDRQRDDRQDPRVACPPEAATAPSGTGGCPRL